jgi:hypothetical protein
VRGDPCLQGALDRQGAAGVGRDPGVRPGHASPGRPALLRASGGPPIRDPPFRRTASGLPLFGKAALVHECLDLVGPPDASPDALARRLSGALPSGHGGGAEWG